MKLETNLTLLGALKLSLDAHVQLLTGRSLTAIEKNGALKLPGIRKLGHFFFFSVENS